MRCVMVMFDSLNRHMLPPYNPDTRVHAPNFRRLADRCATFEKSYVCSMPCMPARRDLHTGRPNFLHCPWGPLEPFDDSVPAMLSKAGVLTHLASDHYHYWEDGGSTYHTRYDTWEFFRGQEGDPWIGQKGEPSIPKNANGKGRRQDWVNRQHMRADAEFSQTQTFEAGLKFIERNHREDGWFLQIECFDPHEPFTCHRSWRDLYPPDDPSVADAVFDWPTYGPVTEPPERVEQARNNYSALMSKCDASLGDILDAFDKYDLWKDTMLIVWTDHGFMLGEHRCWAKNWMPLYEEVAHTPFFVWDPRHPGAGGKRRSALVQPAIDLGPTLLGFFGVEPTADMLGHDLAPALRDDTPLREAAIFGYFGQWVNVTDGRYVYMRAPRDGAECYRYTLMPNMMRGFAALDSLRKAELAGPFRFTKGVPTLKLGGPTKSNRKTMLWDVDHDPKQESELSDPAVEQRLLELMRREMRRCDAPAEQYARLCMAE